LYHVWILHDLDRDLDQDLDWDLILGLGAEQRDLDFLGFDLLLLGSGDQEIEWQESGLTNLELEFDLDLDLEWDGNLELVFEN
jgi:hypothetical protein